MQYSQKILNYANDLRLVCRVISLFIPNFVQRNSNFEYEITCIIYITYLTTYGGEYVSGALQSVGRRQPD